MLGIFASIALLGANPIAPEGTPVVLDRPTVHPSQEVFVLKAKKLLAADGSVQENVVVFVDHGRIRSVSSGADGEVPEGFPVVEHDGWISAGLVACHGYSALRSEATDSTRALLPEARVIDGVDLGHRDLRTALASGITSMVVTPTEVNVAGGQTAVIKTNGAVLEESAHLALSIRGAAIRSNRMPTSAGGAIKMLDAELSAGQGAFGRAASGELPVMFAVLERDDVQRALHLAGRHPLRGALYGAAFAGELAAEIKASGFAVVSGPIGVGASSRQLDSMAALGKAGIPLGFGLEAPGVHPETLRFSAAMCLRGGMSRKAAWRALSAGAARIAGVADRVGALTEGLQADIVLWSGDPLDLSSRVEAVYIDGVRIHGAD